MERINSYLSLFKIRIGLLITLSAVVGLVATENVAIDFYKLAFLALATMMASTSAGAMNHYFDRDIDCVMKRTRSRPIPSDIVQSPRTVLLIASVLLSLSFLLASKMLNIVVAVHLVLGAFVYVIVYTVWLKRRSWTNIIIGGLAGSFAVLAGGASATPELCMPPLLLATIMFFWTPSHFWSFAIVHREDYEKAGIPMLPVVIGNLKTTRYILLNTTLLVISSFLPSIFGFLGIFYTLVAVAVGVFFLTRNIQLLFDTSKNMALKNFKASMIYLGVLLSAVIVDVSIRKLL